VCFYNGRQDKSWKMCGSKLCAATLSSNKPPSNKKSDYPDVWCAAAPRHEGFLCGTGTRAAGCAAAPLACRAPARHPLFRTHRHHRALMPRSVYGAYTLTNGKFGIAGGDATQFADGKGCGRMKAPDWACQSGWDCAGARPFFCPACISLGAQGTCKPV
jgi:hypothetical protein